MAERHKKGTCKRTKMSHTSRRGCRSFGPNVGKYPSQPANLFGIVGVCELAVQAIILPRRTSWDRYTVQQFPWHWVFPQLSSAVVYPVSPLHRYIITPLPHRPAPAAASARKSTTQ